MITDNCINVKKILYYTVKNAVILITLDFKKNMEYNIERKRGSLCDRLRGR